MKKLLFLLLGFTVTGGVLQAQLLKRLGDNLKNKMESKANEKINKGVDDVVDGNGKKKDKQKKDDESGTASSAENDGSENDSKPDNGKPNGKSAEFQVNSKYDFVQGEKVIALEDFSQDAIGDYPAKWNTNGSGDLVNINDNKSKFLKLQKESVFYPEFVKGLPDNFTVEFDLQSTPTFSFYSSYFAVGFTNVQNVGKSWKTFERFGNRKGDTKSNVEIGLHPTGPGVYNALGMSYLKSCSNGEEVLSSESDQAAFQSSLKKTNVHVAIWRQKGRLRVYVNSLKVWDVPKAFETSIPINSMYFRVDNMNNDNDAYFLSNIRVAVGAPDTRNKLMTEGKFVTTGILFDVNSDKIKPESNGVLKDIANVLTENSDVKVEIIGHTDSDGDDTANLALSKKRAESVKKILSTQFSIDAARMTTDGKGETQPAAPNTSTEGKANNRRVEFIKKQ